MSRPDHGGRLLAAAHRYGIPPEDWLDLSTGINPAGWPVPPIPPEVWRRLPEDDDGLQAASTRYYGTPNLLPVAGSQAAIQALPTLLKPCTVGILSPCYAEHEYAWQSAGHTIRRIVPSDAAQAARTLDVLVLTNPNNPTGQFFSPTTLGGWHHSLAERGGLLVVDEAFIDATPEASILRDAGQPGLIVLRSLGKFFGLAGLRSGFVAAEAAMLARLAALLGPWTVSHPARWVARCALGDTDWQLLTRRQLLAASARLGELLIARGLASADGCALYRWVSTPDAAPIAEALANQGVLVRHFDGGLRIGLPGDETQWQRFETVLRGVME